MLPSPLAEPVSTRTLVRGNVVTFQTRFVAADGTPLVPADSAQYPAVTITDTEGVVIQTGVGVDISTGTWSYQFMIPADGVVSTDEHPWRIDWFMTTTSGRQVELSQNFAVVDVLTLTPDDRAYTILTALGDTARLMVKYRSAQSEIKLMLKDTHGCGIDMTSSIQSTTADGWYVYWVDTPAWQTVGQYLVQWTSRQAFTSPTQTVIQQLRVPEPEFWFMDPELRMMIDKVQKKAGHVQAYSDSDIYEYIRKGLDIINGAYTPVSYYSLGQVWHSPLNAYVIMAAAVYGLQAQLISETDLSFDFSGQTTTLSQDKTSGYATAIDSLNAVIAAGVPVLKKGLAYQGFAGTNGLRPYSMRFGPFMAKIAGRGMVNDAIIPIGRLGILV